MREGVTSSSCPPSMQLFEEEGRWWQ